MSGIASLISATVSPISATVSPISASSLLMSASSLPTCAREPPRHANWNASSANNRPMSAATLKLPGPLRFFTGNIGLHHIHHLNARIPNYNLQRAHRESPIFRQVPTLTLRDGLRAVNLKLWDQASGKLVTFAEARSRPPELVVERA